MFWAIFLEVEDFSGDIAGWLFFEENIPVIENLFFGEFCFFGVVTIFTVFLRLTFLFD